MTKIEELKQQIQNLSPDEMAQLRSWFWDQSPPLDAEWLKEAEARLAAHRSGELAAVDADEVFKDLSLSRDELAELRNWFWEHDSNVWDAQIEADARSGKLETLRRRYRELVEGKVEGVPGPLFFQRLRERFHR